MLRQRNSGGAAGSDAPESGVRSLPPTSWPDAPPPPPVLSPVEPPWPPGSGPGARALRPASRPDAPPPQHVLLPVEPPRPPGLGPGARPLPPVSWPALCRPSTTLLQKAGQIVPIRIARDDQPNLPGSWPPLDAGFALDLCEYVAMLFTVNQATQYVFPHENPPHPVPVFVYPAREIRCNPDVQSAVRTVGHDVNPTAFHAVVHNKRMLTNGLSASGDRQVVGGRDKAGHDAGQDCGSGSDRSGNRSRPAGHTATPPGPVP
jgi:hypothetical protein